MASSKCSVCQGTGFRLSESDQGVMTGVRCECEREGIEQRLLASSGIPRRYTSGDHWDMTFETFEDHHPTVVRAKRAAREWAEAFPAPGKKGLLLLGKPGCGKTHLAVAMGRAVLGRAQELAATVRFHEERDLLRAIQTTYDSDTGVSESDIVRDAMTADLLILDDVGSRRTTRWSRDILNDVIVHRYNERLPLIMTSNLALGDEGTHTPQGENTTLRDRLGAAIISRLHEMCKIITIRGNDYRKDVRAHDAHI